MPNIKPIRIEKDYEAALARIDELMDAEPGTPEGDELDVLVDLVELYESKHMPMGHPSPIAATEDDVLARLNCAVISAGGQRAFARQHDISVTYVNMVLHRKCSPSNRICNAINVQRRVVYEEVRK